MGAAILARELGIETVKDAGEPALASALSNCGANVILSCGYDRILRPTVLEGVAHRSNVHFGALPRYRGSLSIPWAILNGEARIGVTLHEIAAGIDDGPVIAQRFVEDDGTRSCRAIYDEAVATGAEMALNWLEDIAAGKPISSTRQDEQQATYYPPEHPTGFRIVWRQTQLQVMRQIRAAYFPPFPSAASTIGALDVEFDWPVEGVDGAHETPEGSVVEAPDGRLGIAVLNGLVMPGTTSSKGVSENFQEFARRYDLKGKRFA